MAQTKLTQDALDHARERNAASAAANTLSSTVSRPYGECREPPPDIDKMIPEPPAHLSITQKALWRARHRNAITAENNR
jgi:hypothetical protein